MRRAPYLISACLLGEHCRYNGEHRRHPGVIRFLRRKRYLAVCPEMLAGWGSPRPPVQFHGGGAPEVAQGKAVVQDTLGRDRTRSLVRGIARAVRKALVFEVREAILKEKSPSCGVKRVYRDGKLVRGEGVFTHCLREQGVKVRSEESFKEERAGKP